MDTLAEWLRRLIRNQLTFCRVGSNPASVVFLIIYGRPQNTENTTTVHKGATHTSTCTCTTTSNNHTTIGTTTSTRNLAHANAKNSVRITNKALSVPWYFYSTPGVPILYYPL